MTKITESEVNNIAHLARIKIEQKDTVHYAEDLTNIINLVEQMNQVDTTGIEPMAHPLDSVQRLREDKITEQDERQVFQTCTPHVEAGLYLVPKVID